MSPLQLGTPRPTLAVDIGGTKVDLGAVDASGRVLRRERLDTRQHDDLFDAIDAGLRRLEYHEAAAIGVGCGGPMSQRAGTVSPLNIPQWRSFPLAQRLSDAWQRPVFVDNDAKALALAEGGFGAAHGLDNYLSMVVSTGVGGGIVLDGRLLDGDDGNAGHIGHVNVVPDGRPCACGARGCLEAEISGPNLASISGDEPARAPTELRRHAGSLLGRAVGSVAALLDLQHCFVAGSVALGFGEPFFAEANDAAREVAQIGHAREVTIAPTGLPAEGPLLGAALVAWRGAPR